VKYIVEIRETRYKEVEIEAKDNQHALDKAWEMIEEGRCDFECCESYHEVEVLSWEGAIAC